MSFCFKCGNPLPEGTRFCSRCGTHQAAQQPPQQPQYQQPPQQPQYQPYQQPPQQPQYQPYQQPPQQPQYQPYQQPPQQPQYQPYQQPPQQPQYQSYQQPPQQPQYQPRSFAGTVATQTAKKGSKAALKWILGLVATATLVAVVLVFVVPAVFAKDDETLIRERIQAYEDACNNGDYEAMLDCMDHATRTLMESTMGIMDGLMGEMSGLDIGMSDMFGLAGLMGDYCEIEIQSIEIDGEYATVMITMTMNVYGSEQVSEEAPLPMVKEDGDWYIGGVENLLGSDYMD